MIDLPCCGQIVEQPVNLALGSHVDATRRLVEDQDIGIGGPATCQSQASADYRPKDS